MERVLFGQTKGGEEVECFVIRNRNALEVRCINYGCRLTNIFLPNRGSRADILLGCDTLAAYEEDTTCQGAFIGRYAGRIAGAGFDIDGTHHQLLQNAGPNYLHGSLHHRVFSAEVLGENSVSFSYTSPDGEDGFPGQVRIDVTYTLTEQNELVMEYRAVSDAPTHLNLTNHSYFNLSGGSTIEDHELTLNCDTFLEADEQLLPTGRIADTDGGAFDFHSPKTIGAGIDLPDPQLRLAGGYDHCFIVNRLRPTMLAHAATLHHAASGRTMRLYTTQPGIQLYTGNQLNGSVTGKGGMPITRRSGLCLETQHFPDTPHNPDFPPTLLQAGEKYHQMAVLQFEWKSFYQ